MDTCTHTNTHIRVNNYSTSSYQQPPSVSHLHPFWSNIIEISRVLPVSIIVRLSAADLVWPISCSHHRAQIGVAECKQPIQTTNFRTRDFPRVHPPPPTPPLWFKAFIPLFLSPMKPSLCNSWLEYQMHRRHQHAKRAQPRIKPAISQLLSNSVSYFNENLNIFKIFYLQDPDRWQSED